MTKSRKLFVAATLLAGGYGVACFLGGAPSNLNASDASNSLTVDDRSVFSTLRDFAQGRSAVAPTGQLVPDTNSAVKIPASPLALVPQPLPQQPTWLVATSPSRESLPPIEPPKFSEPPAQTESRPIASPETVVIDTHVPAVAAKARITNVVSTGSGSGGQSAASPWDRWPSWDANATSPPNGSGSRPFTSQTPEIARSAATPASFDISEPARTIPYSPDGYGGNDSVSSGGGRTHVVVDGDSLSKIADRYLDDAALGEEIYRLNKDVLKDPELLPIGIELRIPENRVAASSQRFAGSMGPQAAHAGSPAGMVPVEWKPRSFESEPRAQLLRPVPAGRND